MRQALRRVVLICGGVLTVVSTASANLITNGDFSSGLNGFVTNYGYMAPVTQSSCYPEMSFSIVLSPNVCHNLWADFGDHTTGTGQMMAVNGATITNAVVWAEGPATGNPGLSSLEQNTDYYFSVWAASSYPVSPADLRFVARGNLGGSSVLGTLQLSATTGKWQQFYGTWNSGTNTGVELDILDLNTDAYGNDFALDDLSFDTASSLSPVPEPSSLMVLVGVCLLLLSARRRWSSQ